MGHWMEAAKPELPINSLQHLPYITPMGKGKRTGSWRTEEFQTQIRVWPDLRTKLWEWETLTAKNPCGFQNTEMDTHLMARMDSWHMPSPRALVLGETPTLMMMSCGPWGKGKVRHPPLACFPVPL